MGTAIITTSTAIVTGAVALVSVYLTNRTNNKRLEIQLEHELFEKNKNSKRIKAEELYELTDIWLKSLFNHYFNLTLVMQEKLTYNQYMDLIIDNGKTSKVNFTRLEMILHIYFYDLASFFENVLKKRSEINEISKIYKFEYEKGNINGEQYINPFVKIQQELESYGEVFKKVIANKAINA